MTRKRTQGLAWIDSMSFGRKMLMLGLIALLPVSITLALLLQANRDDVRAAHDQHAGLSVIETLMPVVRSLQEHRGASRAMLAGDASFKPRVEKAAASVNESLAAAQAVIDSVDGEIAIGAHWKSIAERWRSLAERNASMQPAVSFREHSAVIDDALNFFRHVSVQSQLNTRGDSAEIELASQLVERLPKLIERVAQARGFGAGLLARDPDTVTPSDRAALMSLSSMARSMLLELRSSLEQAAVSDPTVSDSVKKVLTGIEPIAGFIELADKQVARSEGERPATAAYFEAGTSALKHGFDAHADLATEMRRHLNERSEHATFTGVWTTLLVLASMLTCALMAWWVYRRLRWALDSAVASARSIADGHLDISVPKGGRDEFGTLLSSLGDMTQSLQRVVGSVRQSASEITVAVGEVATGNVDLSQRTEQQAANLQQTSASMEELSGTVANNAANARQANQLAMGASEVARRGGEVVEQVVATMNEISDSSRKIADIIGVIDGIAFQTNILALNAAVEAARAGEQGRGFSVVAAEVRSLAHRSAQAAHEIKGLITDSVSRVESGGRLVKEAGSTMSEIVTSVRRVTDIIGEISSATAEQSGGIAQVSSAVTELDRMTQQNAALVEQGAAASESLREQARKLIETIDQFRVGEATAMRPAAPVAASPAPKPLAKPHAVGAAVAPSVPERAATQVLAPAAVPARKPVATSTSKPVTSAIKPVTSVSKPAAVTSKPVPAVSKPVAAPAPIVAPAPRATAKAAEDDWEEF